MTISFLPEGPGILLHNTERILVFADIHMGIETDLAFSGIHIQSRGLERIEKIITCIKKTEPDLVLLLGDIKHRITGTSRQEYHEIPVLFEQIRKYCRLGVTPGNHDSGIAQFLQPDELYPSSGILLFGNGFMHGHTRPGPDLAGHLIIAGHHHPSLALRDEVGIALKTDCYLLAELDPVILGFCPERTTRVLFIPSCNELAGYDVRKTLDNPFSHISRAIIRETAEVILPDGTYAGSIPELIPDAIH
ncbi:MAG: metallophosphoesterase [Methanospirillaceae archaeon]|nr:metallophosphoesterase [Methanospirillaceae archaeon]